MLSSVVVFFTCAYADGVSATATSSAFKNAITIPSVDILSQAGLRNELSEMGATAAASTDGAMEENRTVDDEKVVPQFDKLILTPVITLPHDNQKLTLNDESALHDTEDEPVLITDEADNEIGTDARSNETERELVDVIIDAGSTGTRVYLFHHRLQLEENFPCNVTVIGHVDGGLAQSHKEGPDVFKHHLTALASILDQVKEEIQRDSKVLMYGTAGMRAYTEDNPELDREIWARVQETLNGVFGREGEVQTIDGRTEGMYSLLSVNFLAAQENIQKHAGNAEPSLHIPMGSLDLGGSSSQIGLPPLSDNVKEKDLVIKSFVGAGMKVAHNSLSEEQKALCNFSDNVIKCSTEERNEDLCVRDEEQCRNVIEKVLGPTIGEQMRNITRPSAALNGGVTPGNFVAISGFFYVASFLRHLGALKTFEPTWNELREATDEACKMTIADVELELGKNPHQYTPIHYFKNRCFQANYILKVFDWYGFPKDTLGAVVFKFKINNNEVEWPLGALIYRYRPNLTQTFCSSRSCFSEVSDNERLNTEESNMNPVEILE